MKLYFRWIAAATISALAAGAALPPVVLGEPSVPADRTRDLLPSGVSLFSTSADAAAAGSATDGGTEVLRRPGLSFGDADDGAPSKKQSWWPLLYSAILPGTGELAMGYEGRGITLIAAEVVAWTGYFYYHDNGMATRDDYEGFADAHWNMQKFIDDHPLVYPALSGTVDLEWLENEGRSTSGSGVWPGYIVWTGKEDVVWSDGSITYADKQHYYENIGKYDWFISGWEDWDPDLQPRDTDLRTQYRSMRIESNDDLDKANQFLYISLIARVVSLVETSVLIVKARNAYDEQQAQLGNHWRFKARPEGTSGAVVALEYNFK